MKYLLSAAMLALAVLASVLTWDAERTAQASQIASGRGIAEVQGRAVAVEVLVAVAPGTDAAEAARAAVAELGARPLDVAEYTTTGLVWDQFSDGNAGNNVVVQNYNSSKQPTSAALQALQNSQATWTSVATSSFAFQYGGATNRCPSLVQQCKGPQVFDTFNDVGWADLGRCTVRCTLGVTWYSTSGNDEADMALNTRAPWRTNGQDFDIETVMLHENGHTVGLGHSSDTSAVMYAYYQGTRRALAADDITGVSALYP